MVHLNPFHRHKYEEFNAPESVASVKVKKGKAKKDKGVEWLAAPENNDHGDDIKKIDLNEKATKLYAKGKKNQITAHNLMLATGDGGVVAFFPIGIPWVITSVSYHVKGSFQKNKAAKMKVNAELFNAPVRKKESPLFIKDKMITVTAQIKKDPRLSRSARKKLDDLWVVEPKAKDVNKLLRSYRKELKLIHKSDLKREYNAASKK